MSVYVSASLCGGAERELAREGGRAGEVRVRVVCLDEAESGGRLDLAAIGANARRAVEDSSTVAYVGEPIPAASRFSRPILESAEIPQLSGLSGAAAMRRVLRALRRADASRTPRESLHDALG